jgi:hypothetical protein
MVQAVVPLLMDTLAAACHLTRAPTSRRVHTPYPSTIVVSSKKIFAPATTQPTLHVRADTCPCRRQRRVDENRLQRVAARSSHPPGTGRATAIS